MMRYLFPDERTGKSSSQIRLEPNGHKACFIRGLHVLCMWSYYTVRSVHCAQGAMGNGASALALLVKQGPTADAVLWPNLLKIAMYKDGWIITQMAHGSCCSR